MLPIFMMDFQCFGGYFKNGRSENWNRPYLG